MTKKAYAAHRGCKPTYISKRDVAERLESAMVLQDGKWLIDSDKADEILSNTRDPAADLVGTGDDTKKTSGKYTEVRTSISEVRLEGEKLDLAERKNQTLPRGKTYQAAVSIGQNIRELLQGRNRRLADTLATMKDSKEILVLLEKEDRKLLETISNDFLRKLQAAGGHKQL